MLCQVELRPFSNGDSSWNYVRRIWPPLIHSDNGTGTSWELALPRPQVQYLEISSTVSDYGFSPPTAPLELRRRGRVRQRRGVVEPG